MPSNKDKEEDIAEEQIDETSNSNNQSSKKKKKNKKKKKKGSKKTGPASDDHFAQEIKERIRKTIEVINDPEWKLEKTSKDVKIYRLAPKDELFHKVKGVTEVPCTAEMMATMQEDIETNLPLSDPWCQRIKVLKRIDDKSRVCYGAFHSPGRPLISDRDFIFIDTAERHDDLYFSIAFSVDEEEWGVTVDDPMSGCVRAVIMETGYMWREIRENVIELTYIVQVDPKGWIPAWVVNLGATEQAMNVWRVKEFFEAKNKEAEKIAKE